MQSPATIWVTTDRQHFFHIPADVELPDGELVIRSLAGRRRQVDAEAVQSFAMPHDEGMRAVKQLTRERFDAARAALTRMAADLRRAGGQADATPGQPEDGPAAVLGAEDGDSEAISEGARALGRGLASALKAALSTDPADQVKTRQRMREAASGLGLDPDDASSDLRSLQDALSQAESEGKLSKAVRDATARLKAATDRMREARRAVDRSLETPQGEQRPPEDGGEPS